MAKKKPAKRGKLQTKSNVRQIIIMVLVGLALIAFVLPDMMSFFGTGPNRPAPAMRTNPSAPNPNAMPEPVFTKEGELTILSGESGQAIKTIDIEKADNNDERMFGMMYRKSMPDEQGMLFLFDQSEPQSFWMKNTFIPLDIMFIDEDYKITTIHANAQPHTETPRLSKGPAKYVLEVNGGWAERHGVQVGDVVKW